jgi:hypothetical protein
MRDAAKWIQGGGTKRAPISNGGRRRRDQKADEAADERREFLEALKAEGISFNAIAHLLNGDDISAPRGGCGRRQQLVGHLHV